MKKSSWGILIGSVVVGVILIVFGIVYNIITDPGGNKKYEIDVDERMQNNLNNSDSAAFRNGLTTSILKDIQQRGEKHEYLFDPHSRDTIGKVKDSILDVFFTSKIVNSDGSRTLVFGTFLKTIYCYDLKSGEKPYFDQYTIFSSAVLFDNHDAIKRIECQGETEYIYYDSVLNRSNEYALFSSRTNIQHVLVDYKYFGTFPALRIEDEGFWKRLEE